MDKKRYPGSLHNHTDYSNFRLRDAINSVEGLINKAIELEHRAVGITDHETVAAAYKSVEYYNKIKEKNPDFKVILGNEIYLTRNGLTSQNFQAGEDYYYHFLLLAKDGIGHEQLRELSTRAWSHSFRRGMIRVPTYYQDLWDIVSANPGHLVASSACLGGLLPLQLLKYREMGSPSYLLDKIKKWLLQMVNLFGEGNFFLEMQPSKNEEQIYVNNFICKLSREMNIPTIITLDAHYLSKEEQPIHHAFLTAEQGDRETEAFYASTYMMNTEELEGYMERHIGKAMMEKSYDNINKIIDSCSDYSFESHLNIPYLPRNPIQPTTQLIERWIDKIPHIQEFMESEWESSQHLIGEILTRIEKDKQYQTEATYIEIGENLQSLLDASHEQNVPWSAYLLNVKDYVDLIWDEGDSIVPPGRGSSGSFLLNNILGITQYNPLREKTKVYAWRFLNPERVSPLDIDIDIESAKRDSIMKTFQKAYGEACVAKVLTLRTEKSKSALLTAFRGHNIDADQSKYVSSLIVSERGVLRTLTEMFYGNKEEGIKPVKEFKRIMTETYPEAWETAKRIENLICGMGVHASGIIIADKPFYKTTGLMKSSGGDVVTQFNLDELEAMGLIKFDLLGLETADRIRTALDLLVEYGYVKPEKTLRETYEKVVGVYNLERDDQKMWEMVWNHEVQGLFQMEQPSGVQGIESTKPKSIDDLATLNSVIRLMASERGAEQPLAKYQRFKENPRLWVQEMQAHGVSKDEQELLKDILDISYGILETQEKMMLVVQLPELGGHSLLWADRLRRAVAKKMPQEFEELETEFFDTIQEQKLSLPLAQYVWDVLIRPNRGYGFNSAHTLAYSFIGLQQMNLAYRYPVVFWNTACLIVDSGGVQVIEPEDEVAEEIERIYSTTLFGGDDIEEDDDDDDDEDEIRKKPKAKKKARAPNYGKIASAIGKFQSQGITILPPDINKSRFTFSPDVEANAIKYGLSGLARVGEDLIKNIIAKRPYLDLPDFLEKVKINKLQAVSLIKAGAFDAFGYRQKIMRQYLEAVAGHKKRLTLSNMRLFLEYDLLPDDLKIIGEIHTFNRELKKTVDAGYYVFDPLSLAFYEMNFSADNLVQDDGLYKIAANVWDNIYKKSMNPVRTWVKENQAELLTIINNKLTDEIAEKYAQGNLSKWEMDSIFYYSHEHELINVDFNEYHITNFNDLAAEPEVDYVFYKDRKAIVIYKIYRIAGTVLDRDRTKGLISLLTTDGVVQVRIFGQVFKEYDRQISKLDLTTGKKKILEKSWFTRGNKIIVSGIKRGENVFLAKKYAKTAYPLVEKIVNISDNGILETRSERIGVD